MVCPVTSMTLIHVRRWVKLLFLVRGSQHISQLASSKQHLGRFVMLFLWIYLKRVVVKLCCCIFL